MFILLLSLYYKLIKKEVMKNYAIPYTYFITDDNYVQMPKIYFIKAHNKKEAKNKTIAFITKSELEDNGSDNIPQIFTDDLDLGEEGYLIGEAMLII